MGSKEFNSLFKNLFQKGLMAIFLFRHGGRFIFFHVRRGGQDAKGYRKQPFAACLRKAGFARKTLLLPFAKNPPNPLNKSLSRRIAGGSSIPAIPSH